MEAENKGTEKDKTSVKDVITRDKGKRKVLLFVLIGVVLVLLAVIIVGSVVWGGNGRKLQEQLDLGAKYLEEMDYEQALVAFNTVLSIEPQNADAYLGIVEVYIRTNEFEAALEYAKKGYEATGDERLKEKIDMIESGDIFAANGWSMRRSFYGGDGNLLCWHEYTYNLNGQQASVARYNAQGVQEQYLELSYNEEGKTIVSYGYHPLTGEISKNVIEYSGVNSFCVTSYVGTSDVVSGYNEYEADSAGHLMKATGYDADNHFLYSRVNEYNGDGKITRMIFYNANGEQTGYDIYTYDENGRISQLHRYDGNGNISSYSEYVYGDEGSCIRYYDADGVLQYEEVSQ